MQRITWGPFLSDPKVYLRAVEGGLLGPQERRLVQEEEQEVEEQEVEEQEAVELFPLLGHLPHLGHRPLLEFEVAEQQVYLEQREGAFVYGRYPTSFLRLALPVLPL